MTKPTMPYRECECGRRILARSQHDLCSYCRGVAKARAHPHLFDPTEDPIGWVRDGLILRPVYRHDLHHVGDQIWHTHDKEVT